MAVVALLAMPWWVAAAAGADSNLSLLRLREAMVIGDLADGPRAEAAFADAIELARADADIHDEQAALLMRAE